MFRRYKKVQNNKFNFKSMSLQPSVSLLHVLNKLLHIVIFCYQNSNPFCVLSVFFVVKMCHFFQYFYDIDLFSRTSSEEGW